MLLIPVTYSLAVFSPVSHHRYSDGILPIFFVLSSYDFGGSSSADGKCQDQILKRAHSKSWKFNRSGSISAKTGGTVCYLMKARVLAKRLWR